MCSIITYFVLDITSCCEKMHYSFVTYFYFYFYLYTGLAHLGNTVL